jgi:hypothetical protein
MDKSMSASEKVFRFTSRFFLTCLRSTRHRSFEACCIGSLTVGCHLLLSGAAWSQSNQIRPSQLLGSLSIDIDVDLWDPVPTKTPGYSRSDKFWLFLNGELIGPLPQKLNKLVTEGQYDLRVVYFELQKWAGPAAVGLGADVRVGAQFHTVLWRLPVALGQPTHFQYSISPFFWNRDDCLSGSPWWKACEKSTQWLAPADFAREKGKHPYMPCGEYCKTYDHLIAEVAEWRNKIFQSEAWKAFENASRLPPARRRAYVDLPAELGGGRELDVSQLQALQLWFQAWFDDVCLKQIITLFDGQLALDPRANALYQAYLNDREFINRSFSQFSERLEKARED